MKWAISTGRNERKELNNLNSKRIDSTPSFMWELWLMFSLKRKMNLFKVESDKEGFLKYGRHFRFFVGRRQTWDIFRKDRGKGCVRNFGARKVFVQAFQV